MGGKELGFGSSNVRNLKEELARKTWRIIRSEGHTYVDLRKDGKGFVYFCTLCLAPCYSEPVLRSHLGGNFHREMFNAAKATLIGENPWPFDDGILFFEGNADVEEKDVASEGNWKVNLLEDDHEFVDNLAVVVHNGVSSEDGNGVVGDVEECIGDGPREEAVDELVIPNVVWMDEVTDVRAKLMGYGKISANLLEKDGVATEMHKIWCEWVGNRDGECDDVLKLVPSHDFAVVTFKFNYDLGIKGLYEDANPLLLTGVEESNDGDCSAKRRKISFSDEEDANKALSCKSYSSGEESQGSSTSLANLLLDLRRHGDGDDLLNSKKYIPNNELRKILREDQRVASKRACYICKQKMLKGKDVATLMNLKTGRLACSSRNPEGAFHVFHTSCLIHWILLCESEIFMQPLVNTKARGKSNRRVKSKVNQSKKKIEELTVDGQISSVFCPDCQGTGLQIEGDELEQPAITLSKMLQYELRVATAHRAWMKCPEELKNCSTGFTFPVQDDRAEVKTIYKKFLKFYRAVE